MQRSLLLPLKKAGTNLRLIGQLFVDIKQVITIFY